MIALKRLPEHMAAVGGMGSLRQVRYAAVVIAIAGLGWSSFTMVDSQLRDDRMRTRTAGLRGAVADLHLRAARQLISEPAAGARVAASDSTAEGLVVRVGEAARSAGLHLAQSRVVVTPASAQAPPPAPAQQGGATQSAAQTHAPPAVDAGGVEFHLAGSYADLKRMLKTLGESHSRFQIVTLDVMRSTVAPKTGAAQVDIRLVCTL